MPPPMSQLCNSLLHKFLGVTMSGFWIWSKTMMNAFGTSSKPLRMALCRAVLEYQIGSKLYQRQGKAITNFVHRE